MYMTKGIARNHLRLICVRLGTSSDYIPFLLLRGSRSLIGFVTRTGLAKVYATGHIVVFLS